MAIFEQRQKDFLSDVFSRSHSVRHVQSEAINRPLPAPIQCREGFFVTIQYPRQKCFVTLVHLVVVGRPRAASVMNSAIHPGSSRKLPPRLAIIELRPYAAKK